jgi:hypothetical protein
VSTSPDDDGDDDDGQGECTLLLSVGGVAGVGRTLQISCKPLGGKTRSEDALVVEEKMVAEEEEEEESSGAEDTEAEREPYRDERRRDLTGATGVTPCKSMSNLSRACRRREEQSPRVVSRVYRAPRGSEFGTPKHVHSVRRRTCTKNNNKL